MAGDIDLHVTVCSTFEHPVALTNFEKYMDYAALEGATVVVMDNDGVTPLGGGTGVTDKTGYLLIEGLAPTAETDDFIFVEVSAPGYVTKRIKLYYATYTGTLYCAARMVMTTTGGV